MIEDHFLEPPWTIQVSSRVTPRALIEFQILAGSRIVTTLHGESRRGLAQFISAVRDYYVAVEAIIEYFGDAPDELLNDAFGNGLSNALDSLRAAHAKAEGRA